MWIPAAFHMSINPAFVLFILWTSLFIFRHNSFSPVLFVSVNLPNKAEISRCCIHFMYISPKILTFSLKKLE